MNFFRHTIDEQAQREMSFILYHGPDGILAAIFASMPLALKQHCIKVGAVSGIVAEQAPDSLLPEGMTRRDYANAIRYGGFYHDLGAYLAYNDWAGYPAEGRKILEREISKDKVAAPVRRVILETVGSCMERYDGEGYPERLSGERIPFHAGICAIANVVDDGVNGSRRVTRQTMAGIERYIKKNEKVIFLPEAVREFMKARRQIYTMYRTWSGAPPLWKRDDLRPDGRPYGGKS